MLLQLAVLALILVWRFKAITPQAGGKDLFAL